MSSKRTTSPDDGARDAPQTPQTRYLLEDRQLFSSSLLWDLQRQYYQQAGIDAWRRGQVPQYATSNLSIADTYAELVLAFLRDQNRLAAGGHPSNERQYICELGAGSGRFAFHFLSRLENRAGQDGVSLDSFRYVLTDFAQSNLDFWRAHPRFQKFFESGVLDLALFDVRESDRLELQISGDTIAARRLGRPLVVVANYLFDTIPQDLYYIQDRHWYHCLVSLLLDEHPSHLSPAEFVGHLHYRYDCEEPDELSYEEPYLQELLLEYQQTLHDTHLLFPSAGLRCLHRMRELSRHGVMVLSADKGDHRLEALHAQPPPQLVHHGSFSLNVNYHAFKRYCEQAGGVALFPDRAYENLNVGCLLMVSESQSYAETKRSYRRSVQDFGPDDFYSIADHAARCTSGMSMEEIMAYLRLGRYDSHQLAHYIPRLMELIPSFSSHERHALIEAVERVWESYFPVGEGVDLAYHIGCMLYAIDDYPRALTYFQRSIEIYGPHSGTLYNAAVCHHLLGEAKQAAALLQTVVSHDPENAEARELLLACAS